MNYDYDLIIIGGGAAGLSAANKAIRAGAKTALVEKNKLGGACTWNGCIPSKALLKSARVFSDARRINEYGISPGTGTSYDTRMVMAHVRSVIMKMATHAEPEFYEKSGINVLFGQASFVDDHTVRVNEDTVTARHFLICSGSEPLIPPLKGLKEIDYLTNRNLFDLGALPDSVAVIGGGPIGVEIAQALALLGVKVFLIEMKDHILSREDRETAAVLAQELLRNGIAIHTGTKAVAFAADGSHTEISLEDRAQNSFTVRAERVFVATGRAPVVDGLGLEQTGVQYSPRGIVTDASLKTNAENIYACGDVTGLHKFAHMAGYQADIAMANILYSANRTADYSTVPWVICTAPELAHFGPTEDEARERYGSVHVYKAEYRENDRALAELADTGVAKVICDDGGKIIGAHIVGAGAGEIIHEYILAKTAGIALGDIGTAVHIYPTLSRIIKATSEQYRVKERLRELEESAVT